MPPHGHGPGGEFAAQHAQWAAHGEPFFPFLGGLMFLLFLLLVVGGLAYLRRTGQLGAPPWARRVPGPEHEAREILATRLASGDISTEDFLERASVLNWTPGVQPVPALQGRKR